MWGCWGEGLNKSDEIFRKIRMNGENKEEECGKSSPFMDKLMLRFKHCGPVAGSSRWKGSPSLLSVCDQENTQTPQRRIDGLISDTGNGKTQFLFSSHIIYQNIK